MYSIIAKVVILLQFQSWKTRKIAYLCLESIYKPMNYDNPSAGYQVKQYSGPVKRYCQTLSLRDDPQLIEEYCRLHSPEVQWREIRDGIRAVGILEMEIYILDTSLFMIVETPLDFDWDEAMARLATLPRQAEWEATVAAFQLCRPGSTSSEKWILMRRIFHLYK